MTTEAATGPNDMGKIDFYLNKLDKAWCIFPGMFCLVQAYHSVVRRYVGNGKVGNALTTIDGNLWTDMISSQLGAQHT